MAHEVKVSGAVHPIKYGETKVGGVVQKIKYGETKIGGVVQKISFDGGEVDDIKEFADTPWSEIVKICRGISEGGEIPETWDVGATHKLKIYDSEKDANADDGNLNYTEYDVEIIGFEHDSGEDWISGVTLQLSDCFDGLRTMDYGGEDNLLYAQHYGETQIFYDMENIFRRIEKDVRENIVPVLKFCESSAGGGVELYAKLFLLSENEVFGNSPTDKISQQYQHYRVGGSTEKNYNGSPYEWWLRSKGRVGSNISNSRFGCVEKDGSFASKVDIERFGVSFAFCL